MQRSRMGSLGYGRLSVFRGLWEGKFGLPLWLEFLTNNTFIVKRTSVDSIFDSLGLAFFSLFL